MKAVLAALLLAVQLELALGSCANQCSGHGRCGANDQCICYQSSGAGAKFSYTGADCSQRTCPVGVSFDYLSTGGSSVSPIVFTPAPGQSLSVSQLRVYYIPQNRTEAFKLLNKDTNFVVKVMSTSAITPYGTFTWKFDTDDSYEPESNIASSNSESRGRGLNKVNLNTGIAVDTAQTGVFVWWDNSEQGSFLLAPGDIYTFTLSSHGNIDFLEGDSNTPHQDVECSGKGTCDVASGKCACIPGYTGEACQRSVCSNDCNGNGVCQSQARFIAGAGITDANNNLYKYTNGYDGDKNYGCKCDAGYRGPDCSLIECSSGDDPMGGNGGSEGMDCSGRGNCDYTQGICNCYKGFSGERCEMQTTYS